MINYFNAIGHPEVGWLIVFVLSGAASNLVSRILLRVFRGKWASFNKDKLGKFIWDWLVFAPIVTSFYIVSWLDQLIRAGAMEIGYRLPYLGLIGLIAKPGLLIVFAFVFTTIGAALYAQKGEPKWLASPPQVALFRGYLINIPMTIFAALMFFLLAEHWWALHSFLQTTWRPATFLNIDGMYGLRWVNQVLLFEAVIAILISLTPLLMYLREAKPAFLAPTKKQGSPVRAWVYGVLSVLGIVFSMSYFLYLIPSFGHLLKEINSFFLTDIVNQLNILLTAPLSQDSALLLQETVLMQRVSALNQLPQGFSPFITLAGVSSGLLEASTLAIKALFGVDLIDLARDKTIAIYRNLSTPARAKKRNRST